MNCDRGLSGWCVWFVIERHIHLDASPPTQSTHNHELIVILHDQQKRNPIEFRAQFPPSTGYGWATNRACEELI